MPQRILEEQVVPGPEVPRDPIRCPKCRGGNLLLHGNLVRPYVQTVKNGEITEGKASDDPITHEVEAIECEDCQIRFVIQTREMYDLLQANGKLAEQLARVLPNLRPC